jgi:microsomal dipeptidase-like Zn-dependent dipeptidase
MVALATDDMGAEYLTGYVKKGHVELVSERTSLEAQLAGMQALANENSRWMQIAHTAAEARDIIRHNKLAVIPGVEVDQLGSYGFPSPTAEVQYLWGLGVRAVTPIHAVDNSIGGPAVLNAAYNWLNDLLNRGQIDATVHELGSDGPIKQKFFQIDEEKCTGTEDERGECVMYKLGVLEFRVAIMRPIFAFFRRAPWIDPTIQHSFDTKRGQTNQQGLTPTGQSYIAALMDRGMILDTAHMSDKSVEGTYQAIRDRLLQRRADCSGFSFDLSSPSPCDEDAYPAIVSHAHFRAQAIYDAQEPIPDFLPSEYDIGNRHLETMRRVGGVVGPFVTESRIDRSNIPGIADDCGMSSKNFAFSFHFALSKLGANVGMATDFTFIPLMAPRFGKHACEGFKPFRKGSLERSAHHARYNAAAQKFPVVYGNASGSPDALSPYKMGTHTYDFNRDGLAHYGLVPDMLQDLRNLGLPRDDFQALYPSAEAYLKMWEKAERLSNHP